MIYNMMAVMMAKMMLGNHVPRTGGRPPETENTVEICCRNTKVNTNPMPKKTWTPTPRVVFRHETLTANNVIIRMPTGLANRLCRSIW